MLSLAVLLIGLVVDRAADDPRVSSRSTSRQSALTTTYRGAAADIIETQITTVIEDSISGIEGIKTIKSVSREGSSEITVTFRLERDPDDAAADVRDRVGRVRADLPERHRRAGDRQGRGRTPIRSSGSRSPATGTPRRS